MRTKTLVCRLDSLLKVSIEGRLIDQPKLPDLESFQFASSQKTVQILRAITAILSGGVNRYVVVHNNQLGNRMRIHLKPHEVEKLPDIHLR